MKQEYLKIAGVVVLLLPSCTYRQPVISSIQHDTVAIQSEVRLATVRRATRMAQESH